MNLESYIASGILEAYALGEVTPTQKQKVEQYLIQYPELRVDLNQIERTLEALVFKNSLQPRKRVKEVILSKIDEQTRLKTIIIHAKPVWRYATAASIAIALATSFMAYYYYTNWADTSIALNNLIAQNQQIAQDYNLVNEKLNKIQNDFSIIENSAFAKIVMKGTDNAPESMASVYWNSSTREVYLSIQNLREISRDNQFQLWAIVDGKPMDAGVFDLNFDGLIPMKSIEGAVAFAVTIEPRGGVQAPTLETMQVIGNLSKS